MTDDKNYKVGRGKPPKEHQFKPGRSGNPSGRPKKKKTFIDHVAKEFGRKVEVTEGGRRKRYTIAELVVRQTATAALKGGPRDREFALALLEKHDAVVEAQGGGEVSRKEREKLDRAAMDAFLSLQRLCDPSEEEEV